MHRLLDLLYKYRAFLFFIFLETIALYLFFQFNFYQGATYFNTSNYMVGSVLKANSDIRYYFKLGQTNEELAEENALLRFQLTRQQQMNKSVITDTSEYLRTHQFAFIPARIINNTTERTINYFTIDRGLVSGIKPGMGVVGPKGVIGEIRNCSDHFCNGTSILWSGGRTFSAKIIHTDIEGFVKWEKSWNGGDPLHAKMTSVGRHHKLKVGDTIVTSGYNPLYPAGIPIGYIENIKEEQAYYDITIRFATDFTELSYVYVIENNLKEEQDSLTSVTEKELKDIR